MTIQTRIRLSLGGLLVLMVIVALAGYLGGRTVAGLANYYSTGLIPGVTNYGDMRHAAARLKLHVYQQDFDGLEATIEEAERTVEVLAASAQGENAPFEGNTDISSRIVRTVELMDRLIREVERYEPGSPIDGDLLAAFQAWDDNAPEAEYVIDRIVSIVDAQIGSILDRVLNVIAGVALVSVVIFILVAFSLSRRLKRGIERLLGSFGAVSNGDLTARADETHKDEFGQLAHHFNQLAGSLAETLGQVTRMSQELHDLSAEFNQASRNYSDRARHQSDETQQVATAMTEMSASVREVAQNAVDTARRAQDVNQQAGQSRTEIDASVQSAEQMQQQMKTLSDDILSLKDQTDDISVVVKTINDIAEQTNLLALNAAIEAARAGDHGRGFAVVADEVRTLSIKTAESTKQIEKVIDSLQRQGEAAAASAQSSVEVVTTSTATIGRIGEGLQQILGAIEEISSMNEQIATTSEEQSKVAEDMNTNVVRISDLSEDNARETEHLVAGIQHIDEMSGQLKELVSSYQVS
ncbi:methyl-accepting chemotaxis protein [Saccharospirillum salsuginis]|uniref:Methyl-accepting chemotaxis protein n=1 Tax=Saccharospirillum salsuginis TaxID=418750 RepID=A0A918KAR1_9GAMM|nr:methyl-accepting chemotaxis protein [Saccharospirillum salsuginis]GGX56897.1 methyl-accepting chemotaxis protein [Saccharospirillum salsuginis]